MTNKKDYPFLQLPKKGEWLVILPDYQGEVPHYHLVRFEAHWSSLDNAYRPRGEELLATASDLEDAFDAAELWTANNLHEEQILSLRSAPWHSNPTSERQAEVLRKMGVRNPPATSGEASRLITERMAQRIKLPASIVITAQKNRGKAPVAASR